MSKHDFTWEGDGYDIEGDPCERYELWGKHRRKLPAIPPSQRKVADECWCGSRKHVGWLLCSICQVVLEKDAKP